MYGLDSSESYGSHVWQPETMRSSQSIARVAIRNNNCSATLMCARCRSRVRVLATWESHSEQQNNCSEKGALRQNDFLNHHYNDTQFKAADTNTMVTGGVKPTIFVGLMEHTGAPANHRLPACFQIANQWRTPQLFISLLLLSHNIRSIDNGHNDYDTNTLITLYVYFIWNEYNNHQIYHFF